MGEDREDEGRDRGREGGARDINEGRIGIVLYGVSHHLDREFCLSGSSRDDLQSHDYHNREDGAHAAANILKKNASRTSSKKMRDGEDTLERRSRKKRMDSTLRESGMASSFVFGGDTTKHITSPGHLNLQL